MKCEGKGMEDIAALFAQRGEVGADGAERLCAGDGTETPRGFLLELGHADIAFGQIIIEGHALVGEKPQDVVRVLAQTQQKIGRGGLLDTATLFYFGASEAITAAAICITEGTSVWAAWITLVCTLPAESFTPNRSNT